MKTMELIKGKHLGAFAIMPAPEGVCPECAVKHDQSIPHDQQSMFYQYKFYNEHGRWPTWEDAMAHCTDEMKQAWTEALKEHGLEIK